jgi:hypothetical protein
MNFSPNSPARMETPRCLFVAHVLVEVLYFTFVKSLQIEAGSSLSEKNQARHRRDFAGGEESLCLRDESSSVTEQSGGVLAALKAF